MLQMPLHINIEADPEKTVYTIHNFTPDVRPGHAASDLPQYNYVVLSHGAYNGPTQVRVFINRDDLIAMYDKLTPIVEGYRAQTQTVAQPINTQEVALL